MSKYLTISLLVIILIIGILVRFYNLGSSPIGFFCDEAATGYNAYTLIHQGTDEFGTKWPIFFRSFDNFRPSMSFYLDTPFIAIFGLNELSTRAYAATVGVVTIIILYLVTYELCSSYAAALASAFFLDISPWHIQFSRYGTEDILLPLALLLPIYFFLKFLKSKKNWQLWMSCFFCGLGTYTYFPAYFLMPILLMFLFLFNFPMLIRHKKTAVLGLIIFAVLEIPLILGIFNQESLGRLHQVTESARDKSYQQIAQQMLVTYRDHFAPEFLFSGGDIGYHTHLITRFSVRGMGELYLFQLPLILLGLFYLRKYKKALVLIVLLLLIYPLGSTAAPFTDGGGPFATRSIAGVIPFQILSALGFIQILTWAKTQSKHLAVIAGVIVLSVSLWSFTNYLNLYFNQYPVYSSGFWGYQYGPRDIMKYFLANKGSYDDLFLSNEFNAPDIFLTFYDPENKCRYKCQLIRLTNGQVDINPSRKQLFALSPKLLQSSKYSPYFEIRQIIFYPDHTPAFYIGVFKLNSRPNLYSLN